MNNKRTKIVLFSGWQDTRNNKEDLAITPFLSLVYVDSKEDYKVYGFGVCWIHYSIFIALGFNTPKKPPFFKKY